MPVYFIESEINPSLPFFGNVCIPFHASINYYPPSLGSVDRWGQKLEPDCPEEIELSEVFYLSEDGEHLEWNNYYPFKEYLLEECWNVLCSRRTGE
jgi:hypothetical protein